METARERRILEIEEELSTLPQGNLTFKNIRGRQCMYLQWTEDGKQKSHILVLSA